jgi:hypothetical protein
VGPRSFANQAGQAEYVLHGTIALIALDRIMSDIALLLLFAVIAVLWLDNRRVQQIAVARCRQACERAGVQFLDDVAPIWRLRLMRDERGALRLRRTYTFEYGTAHGERRNGSIVMQGRIPAAVRLADGTVFDAEAEH